MPFVFTQLFLRIHQNLAKTSVFNLEIAKIVQFYFALGIWAIKWYNTHFRIVSLTHRSINCLWFFTVYHLLKFFETEYAILVSVKLFKDCFNLEILQKKSNEVHVIAFSVVNFSAHVIDSSDGENSSLCV